MKLKLSILALTAASLGVATGQTSYTTTSVMTAWNDARWNNTADEEPYTSTYIANQNVEFTSGNYFFNGMGATINVGNVTVATGANVTFTGNTNAFSTGGLVRTITVASGSVFDTVTQGITSAAGSGFIKEGGGVFAMAGNAYRGGFTLNAGTVIARGVNTFGSGAGNVLTLNGGTVAANAGRNIIDKFAGGIVIGGNVQFGEIPANVALASNTANLTFNDTMNLGDANRILKLGNAAVVTFGGVINNTESGGLTFAANAAGTGRFDVTQAANTFTGDVTITGGEVRFTADGSLGDASNDIVIDGGRFATAVDGTFTLGADRNIFIGDTAGTAISTPGTGTLTINTPIANISGKTGSWTKQGTGTLVLGGANSFGGNTTISQGTLVITTNNVLGDNATVSIASGATLDLTHSGTDLVGALVINGVTQDPGLYTFGTGKLEVGGSGTTPFQAWAAAKGLDGTAGKENGPGDDPDHDGSSNLTEFALNGNPLSGSDNGRIYSLTEDSSDLGTDKELILTIAVRSGAPAFTGSPSPSSSIDGITYSIEGGTDLASFASQVIPVDPVSTGLPAAGSGYEYRSFSLVSSDGLIGKGFLRLKLTKP